MGSPEDPKQELRQRKKRVRMLVIFVGVIIALVFAFRAVLTPFLIALFAAYLLDPLVARMAPLRVFGRFNLGRGGSITGSAIGLVGPGSHPDFGYRIVPILRNRQRILQISIWIPPIRTVSEPIGLRIDVKR